LALTSHLLLRKLLKYVSSEAFKTVKEGNDNNFPKTGDCLRSPRKVKKSELKLVKVLKGTVIPENKYGMNPIGRTAHEDEDIWWQLLRLAHQAKDEGQHDDVDPGENELS